jgi:excisionase family DNA binding protein
MADATTIFLRRQEAAAACGVSIGTLDKLLRDHRIEVVRVGKTVLIPRVSLERLAERMS